MAMDPLGKLIETWKHKSDNQSDNKKLAIQVFNETASVFNLKRDPAISRTTWLDYLNTTKNQDFLQALGSGKLRKKWAEQVFRIIQITNYNLRDMMEQRLAEHPDRILFKEMSSPYPTDWTYEQVFRHLKEIAALFYITTPIQPRVAIFAENSLEGACSDLACLMFNIFNAPLNPHYKTEALLPIFDQLEINIALADTEERLDLLTKIREKTILKFQIYSLQGTTAITQNVPYLVEEGKKISKTDIEIALSRQPIVQNNQVATTMFTSGSTGLPKGVSFSVYNIIAKRFARAAALPEVGHETFLSYLPLYHTFGRYLEMTGPIF